MAQTISSISWWGFRIVLTTPPPPPLSSQIPTISRGGGGGGARTVILQIFGAFKISVASDRGAFGFVLISVSVDAAVTAPCICLI